MNTVPHHLSKGEINVLAERRLNSIFLQQLVHISMRIFNACLMVLFLLEADENLRGYSTNTRGGSKSIKICRIWKKFDSRPKFRKQL